MVVVFALLAPVVSPVFGLQLWGWLPDHGHAAASAVVPAAHSHPWDLVEDHHHDGAPSRSIQIAFTAGSIAGAPALPVLAMALLAVPVLLRLLVPTASPLRMSAPTPALDPPPPR